MAIDICTLYCAHDEDDVNRNEEDAVDEDASFKIKRIIISTNSYSELELCHISRS